MAERLRFVRPPWFLLCFAGNDTVLLGYGEGGTRMG